MDTGVKKQGQVVFCPESNWVDVYTKYTRPELGELLKLLKLDICYTSAQGNYLKTVIDGHEVQVLDCLGGYGSTILGHSPPAIKKTIFQLMESNRPVHSQASIRVGAAKLSLKLNELIRRALPGQGAHEQDYVVTLLNTGTEATEAALKHCLMEWSQKKESLLLMVERKRNHILQSSQNHPLLLVLEKMTAQLEEFQPRILALKGGFHGKTAGSLSATYNPDYKGMYSASVVQAIHIDRNISQEQLSEVLDQGEFRFTHSELGDFRFSSCAGMFIELIQGEGGIQVLEQDQAQLFAKCCQERKIPLVVDEIQSGLYRTGRFLAAEEYGIDPDYILLGKSLGGGYAKISAFVAKANRYIKEFGLLHTSTFSEDDFSSEIALAALRELESKNLFEEAKLFELRVKTAMKILIEKYPGVIKEVRGKGWMLGIEFQHNPLTAPALLDSIQKSGYSTYLFASYLLHRHQIRVAATLNQSHTLRIEPSSLISEEETHRLCGALEDLVEQIYEGKIGRLLHQALLLSDEQRHLTDRQISISKQVVRKSADIPVVTFMTHLIDLESVRRFDPALANLPNESAKHFMNEVGPLGGTVTYHDQIIEGLNGQKIHFQLNGITVSTSYFENAIRAGTHDGYLKVKEAVEQAIRNGSSYIGLGQFTSISSDNGVAFLGKKRTVITTGNSLTIGIAYRELQRILIDKGLTLGDCRVGIVGAAGNICNVYAQLMADQAKELVLIHRESLEKSKKFQEAVKTILVNSKMTQDRILATHDLQALRECDVVISGTNSSQQMLVPELFKDGAIILDIAVPSNVHPSVNGVRGIEYIQGGYVQLPMGQKLYHPVCPAPHGQIFACMAETITLGLCRHPQHFSMGALQKNQVTEILKMADAVGMSLGTQKKRGVFR